MTPQESSERHGGKAELRSLSRGLVMLDASAIYQGFRGIVAKFLYEALHLVLRQQVVRFVLRGVEWQHSSRLYLSVVPQYEPQACLAKTNLH